VVKGVIDDYDALIDLLEMIEHFLNRLDICTKIPPTVAMTEIIVKILVELLSTLALATRQIKQGKPSESIFGRISHSQAHCKAEKLLKKLLGEKDVEAVVQRLDRLTQEEARITATQTLEVVHGLVQNMKVVMDGEQIHQACHPQGVEVPSN
jgi:replicative DNA helicase